MGRAARAGHAGCGPAVWWVGPEEASLQAVCAALHGAANERWFGGVQTASRDQWMPMGQELAKELCLLWNQDQKNLQSDSWLGR